MNSRHTAQSAAINIPFCRIVMSLFRSGKNTADIALQLFEREFAVEAALHAEREREQALPRSHGGA